MPTTDKARNKRMQLILVTLAIMGVLGYLMYTGVSETMLYYLTVSELLDQSIEASEQGARVSGTVAAGSVRWDPAILQLTFTLADDNAAMPVVYQGQVPDSFQEGGEVILEGAFADQVFAARAIMPTCPSKYE
jgi:cytochrome c-type biogenesis protein CcmE